MGTELLTVETAQRAMPPSVRVKVSQEIVDKINGMFKDPELSAAYRDNVIGYSHILKDNRWKIENYLNSVKFVQYKMCGDTNITAYTKAFPDRYSKMIADGKSTAHIHAIVNSFSNSKLTTTVLEQVMVPVYVANMDIFQQAINTQAELMLTARSEKVRSDAAACLIKELRAPEKLKIEIDVGSSGNAAIEALNRSTMELVAQQRLVLESGAANAKEIAGTVINIETETDDG